MHQWFFDSSPETADSGREVITEYSSIDWQRDKIGFD